MTRSARVRLIIILGAAVAALSLLLLARAKRAVLEPATIKVNRDEKTTRPTSEDRSPPLSSPGLSPNQSTNLSTPSPTQTPVGPDIEGTPSLASNQAPKDAPLSGSFVGALKLIIPVLGVTRDQLTDTFMDARSEGRVHDAIDIPAASGTPVVAAADGEIIKLFQSDRGGTTIYQLSTDKKLVFYYAHLQRYADGLVAGKFARQGDVIAYVGDTGNADAGNYHLHFSISVVADPKRYWEGTNINPYPLLRK